MFAKLRVGAEAVQGAISKVDFGVWVPLVVVGGIFLFLFVFLEKGINAGEPSPSYAVTD